MSPRKIGTKRLCGFTLLEVLIAMAAAVVLIAAATSASLRGLNTFGKVEERIASIWVASNQLAEMRIARSWPSTGSYQGEATEDGRTWYYTESLSKTGDSDLMKATVDVYSDPERKQKLGSLAGALLNPKGPVASLNPMNPGIPVVAAPVANSRPMDLLSPFSR